MVEFGVQLEAVLEQVAACTWCSESITIHHNLSFHLAIHQITRAMVCIYAQVQLGFEKEVGPPKQIKV